MTTILVSGVPGVGKTTTLGRVQAVRSSVHVLSVGAAIRQKAHQLGLAGDVRANLTATVTATVVAEAKAEIARMARELSDEIVLVDSHTSTVGEFSVRLTPDTPEYLERIGLSGIVMLRAPIHTIRTRRGGDSGNQRLGQDDDLTVLETVMLSSLASISTNLARPFHVVRADASVDEVTSRLLAAVDDIHAWDPRQ